MLFSGPYKSSEIERIMIATGMGFEENPASSCALHFSYWQLISRRSIKVTLAVCVTRIGSFLNSESPARLLLGVVVRGSVVILAEMKSRWLQKPPGGPRLVQTSYIRNKANRHQILSHSTTKRRNLIEHLASALVSGLSRTLARNIQTGLGAGPSQTADYLHAVRRSFFLYHLYLLF